MRGWIKYFTDGTKECGDDHLVQARLASWTKGRLENIKSVELWQDHQVISIVGPGTYWQSDTFEARVLVNEGRLIERTLYRKFEPKDTLMCIQSYKGCRFITVGGLEVRQIPCEHIMHVKPEWIGKWLQLSMVVNGGAVFDIVDKPDSL